MDYIMVLVLQGVAFLTSFFRKGVLKLRAATGDVMYRLNTVAFACCHQLATTFINALTGAAAQPIKMYPGRS